MKMPWRTVATVWAVGLALLAPKPPTAEAAKSGAPIERPTARRASNTSTRYGRSVGSPTEGKLVGGAHLEEAPYLRILPSHAAGDVRWGLEPLVSALDRAARAVRVKYPDAIASVGHLSKPGGGDVHRHRSHESGRDADVAFYIRNKSGRPLLPGALISFREDGSSAKWKGAHLDEARTWTFIQSLISDPEARVTHIFIATHVRQRLLEYAHKAGIAESVRIRAASVMAQPRGSLPHDDHLHVRIACPSSDHQCIERPQVARRAKKKSARGRHRGGSHGAQAVAHRTHVSPRAAYTKAEPPDHDDVDEESALVAAPLEE